MSDTFRVARSATIDAPREKVFALIEDFHRWAEWSPWDKLDANMQREHSGAPKGKGAVYAWKGNSKVGQGRMEIVELEAPSRVVIKLDFLKPFEAHNQARFDVAAKGSSSEVTWEMTGTHNIMSKIMGLFMSMDKMIGKDFEKGLANMKAAAEKRP